MLDCSLDVGDRFYTARKVADDQIVVKSYNVTHHRLVLTKQVGMEQHEVVEQVMDANAHPDLWGTIGVEVFDDKLKALLQLEAN